jgi:hypothetical protein
VIVVSLLLILVSGGLLAAGVSNAADGLVITSIGVSLLAAASLFLGIRQQRDALERGLASPRRTTGSAAPGEGAALAGTAVGAAAVVRPASAARDEPLPAPAAGPPGADLVPAGFAAVGAAANGRSGGRPAAEPARDRGIGVPEQRPGDDAEEETVALALGDPDPADEPSAEPVMASEVARLATLVTEVIVIDGRPRYHLGGCPHLAGREGQPLPVAEAIELGFTGCSECSAATTLLKQVPRI